MTYPIKNRSPLPLVRGLHVGVAACGHVYHKRPDLLLIALENPHACAAGVWTQHALAAAPVCIARQNLQKSRGRIRGLVVNAGNANVFNGKKGELEAQRVAQAWADRLDCPTEQISLASTGVTAEPFNADPIVDSIAQASLPLGHTLEDAAAAITTTDAFIKSYGCTLKTSPPADTLDTDIHIAAIAKGAGMISPHMATMLAFVFVDIQIEPEILQDLVHRAVEQSFHRISVDGDTSTNDTVMIIATGNGIRVGHNEGPWQEVQEKIIQSFQHCAQMIIADGEGTQRLMRVTVDEAATLDDARRAAHKVINSPLVKTALAGNDANWGRIAVALGGCHLTANTHPPNRLHSPIDPQSFTLAIGGITVIQNGEPTILDNARLKALQGAWQHHNVEVHASLGRGNAQYTATGCDLNQRYIEVNTAYKS